MVDCPSGTKMTTKEGGKEHLIRVGAEAAPVLHQLKMENQQR